MPSFYACRMLTRLAATASTEVMATSAYALFGLSLAPPSLAPPSNGPRDHSPPLNSDLERIRN